MIGGTRNPLGAMALYLGSTLYRIHGTNDVKSIGQAQSSGCFRMMNASVVHLAGVAGVGTVVTVVASLPTGVELSQVPQAPRFLPAPSFRPGGPSIRRRMTIVICATTRCAGGKPVSERSSMTFRSSVLSLVCLAALAGQATARDTSLLQGWTDYRNERFGFSLRYPVDLFQPEKTSEAGDGQVFVSRDGATRLLVGALQNDAGQSPAAYQNYIARESYAGYRIDYRRLAANWFVLSGEGGGKTFYEKVMFSCAGRLINSFAMVYPTDQRDNFDRVVEGMEKSFRPGRECGDRAATLPPPVSEAPRSAEEQDRKAPKGPRSAMADRIARQRGHDVIVVLRRAGPPYDYKYLRGYASR